MWVYLTVVATRRDDSEKDNKTKTEDRNEREIADLNAAKLSVVGYLSSIPEIPLITQESVAQESQNLT
jgi:hypothetical protein